MMMLNRKPLLTGKVSLLACVCSFTPNKTLYSSSKFKENDKYTGKEINDQKLAFVKTVGKTRTDFKFKENSINKGSELFDSGISFCEKNEMYKHIFREKSPIKYYADLYVPNDATLSYDTDSEQLNADVVYIAGFKEIPEEDYIKAIEYYKYNHNIICELLDGIDKQTPKICLKAIEYAPEAYKYVKNQAEDFWIEAIKHNPNVFIYLKDKTPEMCLKAVKINGLVLAHIWDQTEEMCNIAVEQNGLALAHVKNQTHAICLKAVKQNGYAIKHVVVETPELSLAAVQQNGKALEYVRKKNYQISLAAVKQNPEALTFVKF